jgi:hypothetical protein
LTQRSVPGAGGGRKLVRERARPKREEVWRELAARAGGTLTTGWRGRIKAVRFSRDGDTIVLDTTQEGQSSSSMYTRFRVLYAGRDDLRFRVTRRTIFSGLRRFFGVPSLRIGHPDVDAKWVVRSNSEGRIQSMLLLPEVVRALERVRDGALETSRYRKKRAPAETRLLTVKIPGEVREAERLDAGLLLITTILAQLRRIGSAQTDPVAMNL